MSGGFSARKTFASPFASGGGESSGFSREFSNSRCPLRPFLGKSHSKTEVDITRQSSGFPGLFLFPPPSGLSQQGKTQDHKRRLRGRYCGRSWEITFLRRGRRSCPSWYRDRYPPPSSNAPERSLRYVHRSKPRYGTGRISQSPSQRRIGDSATA